MFYELTSVMLNVTVLTLELVYVLLAGSTFSCPS